MIDTDLFAAIWNHWPRLGHLPPDLFDYEEVYSTVVLQRAWPDLRLHTSFVFLLN